MAHVGCHRKSPVDAEAIDYVVGGSNVSALGCAILDGPRRYYASGWKHGLTLTIYLRGRRLGRDKRLEHSLRELWRTGECLVPGSSPGPNDVERRRNDQVLGRQPAPYDN